MYLVLQGGVGLRHKNQCSRTKERPQELKVALSWQPIKTKQTNKISQHHKLGSANNLNALEGESPSSPPNLQIRVLTHQHLGFGPRRFSTENQLSHVVLQLLTYPNWKKPNLCWWKQISLWWQTHVAVWQLAFSPIATLHLSQALPRISPLQLK